MNTIEVGETLENEMQAAGIPMWKSIGTRALVVLRNHDASKVIVPDEVSRTQLRVELASRTVAADCPAVQASYAVAGANLLDAIDTMANADPVIREYWKASGMRRDNEMIPQMGALFGYDSTALDLLWIAAGKR